MLKEIIAEAPVYIAAIALGLNAIYMIRDFFLQRQKRMDAERAKIEKSYGKKSIVKSDKV